MTTVDVLRDLNEGLWRPFRAAYRARDAAAFLAMHTSDLIRAGAGDGSVLDLAAYDAQVTPWFAGLAARGDTLDITFRFTERIGAAGLASERGVYRITLEAVGTQPQVFYGRFHTFARKVDGQWRVAVDYDTNEGRTVTEDTFTAATPIDDLTPFADAS
jgi:ketosteroid isomerase-like protein